MTASAYEEITYPDGRHALAHPEAVADSPLYNEDLAPVPLERRTWTTYAYLALWIGLSVNVASWTLAAALIALGMDWVQALFTIMLANIIVLVPMLLNGHAGTKYGIPFPVFARSAFGTIGANIPALLRAGVACGWFGIQTWIGGSAIFVLVGAIFPDSSWTNASTFGIGFGDPQPWTMWLSFVIFWVMNLYIVLRGMETLRIFESWSAPFLIAVTLLLAVFMVVSAGDLGAVLAQPNKFGGWTGDFWKVFFPGLMAMIAFWSTLSLNIPDFTRFGQSQRAQVVGQAVGLPATMTLFSLVAVITAAASATVYGEVIWDPTALAGRFPNAIVIAVALVALIIATLTTNVAANLVSPSYDFSNLSPRRISFRTGGIITAILAVVIQPWYLYSNPDVYVFTWLGFYGGALGAVAGVLIADYWFLKGTRLRLGDLYRTNGIYSAFNWRGVVALAIGAVLAVGGAYSAPGTGPFPEGGLIGFLQPLYDYSWIVGTVAGFLAYAILAKVFPERTAEAEPEGYSPEMA
ncbi:MAG TPA: NCS1 family nucleobase:cation symporter-1 [Candidatus Limnocylindria bacterium]|jgi:NCS1 family nucleobase:cation symporter-1|nr:NCS1 family nucleobase:cation symporter-1 [Candidatus Limnocylindria bacterium]